MVHLLQHCPVMCLCVLMYRSTLLLLLLVLSVFSCLPPFPVILLSPLVKFRFGIQDKPDA